MLGNAISIWRVRSSMPMASFEYRDSKERMMKRGLDAGRWTLDAGLAAAAVCLSSEYM